MAMIRPETEMKDSGVQWIGDIPSDWNIKPLYACLDEINQKNNPIVTTNILSLTNIDGVIPYSERGNQGNKSKENFEEYKVVYPNTIVANSMNILIGSVGLSKYEGCVSPVYYVYMAKPQVDIRYMNYLFQMEPFQKRLRQFANGILEIRLRVSSHDILHQKVAVPDYDEQQTIADYLDETCSKIDEIIAEAKASVDEYKELKQSVIFEAVTKGLDKDIEMKNSEVVGMGFIPKKWSVVRFMKVNYVRARLGWKGLKAEEYVDVGYPFLAAYHIVNNHLCWESLNCITKERYDESPEIKLSIGDLVLVKDGAGIGKCARIDEMPLGEATVNSSLSVITPNKLLDYRYEYYYFMSPLFQNIIARLKNGMGVPHLTQESMKDIYLPLPSKKEQQDIADYLDNKVVELDSLITEKESLINDLEAYKKSLIYEVVTGKRRVV